MKYFIYARKSSEAEDRQMSSNDDQIAEMQRVAIELKLHVVDIISESKSAKQPGRREFNLMLKRIEHGEAEGILCWKLNRLARNPVDGGQISWLLQQRKIKHIQTYGRAYTPEDNVLMMQVEFGMANQFIKDLKIDVERGMKRKIERGWYPTRPPVGYISINNKIRKLNEAEVIPHPVQFTIVKKLWELLLTGRYSVPDLKKEGDQLGLRKSNGTSYSLTAYYGLFANPFYTGCFYWTPFNGIKTRYDGKHPPMVTSEEFRQAQRIIHGREDVRQRVHSFPYRGIIKCGECNCNITAELKLQAICTYCKFKFSILHSEICSRCKTSVRDMKYPTILNKVYYHCTKKKNPCSQRYVLMEVIEERILSELEAIAIDKDFHDWGMNVIKSVLAPAKNKAEFSLLKKRKTELDGRLNGIVRMRADGELNKDLFDKLKLEVLQDINQIESKLQTETSFQYKLEIEACKYIDFAYEAISLFKNDDPKIKTEVLSRIGSNLILINKKLVIATHKVLKRIKDCEVAYNTYKPSFEPKKNYVKQCQIGEYCTFNKVLCSKLRAIRTCLIDMLQEKDEEVIKKHIRPAA